MPFGCPWNCCPVPLGISIITASLPIRPIRTGTRHLERHLVEAETGIELGRWNLTEESVRQYLESVGDDLDLYFNLGLVPPLALCAYALGALLEKLSLPPGTIHSIQEMDALLPVSIGAEIHGMAVLERPRRRGNLQFTSLAYTLQDGGGATVQTGKTTVLVPVGGEESL